MVKIVGGSKMAKLTPMMEQYVQIKSKYKDAFLFFRLGDFYEMFYDDAIKAAQELEITLTKRDANKENPIPMCGVPYHAAENYIKILVNKGYKVAICEQVEDPKQATGVVKREVVQLITPGTVMDKTMLTETESNYIASVSQFKDMSYVIVYNDLSTGENSAVLINSGWEAVIHELFNRSIKEIVLSPNFPIALQEQLKQRLHVTISYQKDKDFTAEYRNLFNNINDERFMKAFSRLLNYIQYTQKRSLDHLKPLEIIELNEFLSLDMYSKRNLELTETMLQKEKKGSLFYILDDTITSMGARLLKKWLERPLLNIQLIKKRQEIVESLYSQFMEREELRKILSSVYDLERLAGRIAYGNVNARDLIQLKQSLQQLPKIKKILSKFSSEQIKKINDELKEPTDIITLLEESIVDQPPVSVTEGSIIKDGFNEQLDKYRHASKNGKHWIAELEQTEKQITGIKSLKVGYNKVFGYYIEITNANKHLIPEDRYERKQTLRNAERFVTPELKEKEAIILKAEEKSADLEYEIFVSIREQMKQQIPLFQQIAQLISEIDVLQSFATISEQNNYIKPTFSDDEIYIKNGRHPVVEKVLTDDEFVPNDVYIDNETSMLLITGPNMSGKSTYMRQVALTTIMGQIGCFVPADEAILCIVDQIFTRIGAADDLSSGKSTFMVEMMEANYALKNATNRSLILLDEIGRGTSTYDGMALAQAMIEYIHDHLHAKTLFSTHYHELTILEKHLNKLKNVHVKAEEYEGKVVFLHQIQDGAADKSYGIHVAQLAKLPQSLIDRAKEILTALESKEENKNNKQNRMQEEQLSLFPNNSPKQKEKHLSNHRVINELKQLNLLEMTPLEAMNTLYRLQSHLRKQP